MSNYPNPYEPMGDMLVAQADAESRADFIAKTYAHLAAAIGAFIVLETILVNLPGIDRLVATMVNSPASWLVVLGGFIAVSWIAENWANSNQSLSLQYLGLSLYVVAQAVLFVPLVYLSIQFDPALVPTAALATLALFGGLTATVFITRHDFSFLRGALVFGGMAGFAMILCAALFEFQLGPIFTVAMIAVLCGYILYHTSNIVHHYRIGQHVAAALALFASVTLLFWYILRLLAILRR